HNQRVQVAEPAALQEFIDGDTMRAAAVGPVAATGKDRWQVLDPGWLGVPLVAQEGGLVGHVEIDRIGGSRDYRAGTAEMISIGPIIIVVEKTQIGGIGFGSAGVARV